MFQYTHELVLNSLPTGALVKQTSHDAKGAEKDAVCIRFGGEYVIDNIVDKKIYETPGHVGALDEITIAVDKLGLTEGKNYALSLFVKLVDPHAFFEYGYPNYNSFGKQILVDFLKTSDDEADAATIVDSIIPSAMENDLTFVKAEADGANVVLMVGHTGLRFDSLAIAEYDPTTCDSCIGEYLTPTVLIDRGEFKDDTKVEHTTEGKDAFGTGRWLIENLRFPSYPNTRWAAVNEENRPSNDDTLYTMFSFEYKSARPGLGGLSGVGQALEAVTRHIYYVPTSLAATFKNASVWTGVTFVDTTA